MVLYGKKAALERLVSFRTSRRFPHALLFCGDKGVGKRTLAQYTAALLLCEKNGTEPCGECIHCRKVFSGVHPDVIYPLSESENGKYTVENIRKLISESYKKPNDGSLRVCVFEDLDKMSVICQNTLLKFIEEPLAFNRCLFTAEKKSAILETVISRISCIDVAEAEQKECIAALTANGIAESKASELYGLYGGNIGKCLEGAEENDGTDLFRTAADIVNSLCSSKEYDCAVRFASLKTRDEVRDLLGILSEAAAGAASQLKGSGISGALSAHSQILASRLQLKTIFELFETLSELINSIDSNPNLQLLEARCCSELFNVIENGM